ncbi:GPX4 [Lepeophtheirus salmonis]|uniref:Glutathione peroxidase n=1 Tax=Lepeophtheirus salmonis TaxID=72036 RepID=A0A7R8CRA9_LEPSM|nr:GPX4 [Lepeophtheirus salmonis]CAF2903561.1 GPX4 [Lepeophtheirus salmonis]
MAQKVENIYGFKAQDIDGNEVSMEKYKDHVCIILVELFKKYSETEGLRILGFPCNQFGNQEPGTNAEIKEFAAKYGVEFDMFAKIDVNGGNAHPLFNYLKEKQGGTLGNFIKWNFTKFVVDKKGVPVARFAPTQDPLPVKKKKTQ